MRPITERLSPAIRNLVIVQAVLFGLYIMASPLRPRLAEHLALGSRVAAGELWQPLTSLFVHLDLWSFVFDLIGLWFVGATIERVLGRRRFLVMFFASGLLANTAIAAFIGLLQWDMVYAGCGDSVLALFVGLGVIYGRTQVRVFGRLALQARALSAIFVGLSVLSSLMQGAWPALTGTLIAVAIGYFLSGGKTRWILDLMTHVRPRRRSSLQVLDGGRGKSGKSGKKYVN
jgi:membrane associated rhomboid family serine protease